MRCASGYGAAVSKRQHVIKRNARVARFDDGHDRRNTGITA